MYIYTPLCRYWITLYRYVLVFIVPHVDIELEDNKQFISNIPRTSVSVIPCVIKTTSIYAIPPVATTLSFCVIPTIVTATYVSVIPTVVKTNYVNIITTIDTAEHYKAVQVYHG